MREGREVGNGREKKGEGEWKIWNKEGREMGRRKGEDPNV